MYFKLHHTNELLLQSFLDLPNILFKEETEQYRKQLENKNLSDLSKFHNDSGKIMEFVHFC